MRELQGGVPPKMSAYGAKGDAGFNGPDARRFPQHAKQPLRNPIHN